MTTLSTEALEERRKALDEQFERGSLSGMWQARQGTQGPLEPWVWHWQDIRAGLQEAGELYRVPEDVRMRTVQLTNPVLRAQKGTSRTLQVSVQLLKPSERAPAHRHTPPQPRFIVESGGAYTVVDGEQIFMNPGDLIVTPSLSWHDHANPSQENAIWLDIHDPHLVNYLGATLNERFGEGDAQPISKQEGYHRQRLGLFRTQQFAGRHGAFPLKYPWQETLAALEELAGAHEDTPYDGVMLEYRNPLDGGPAMPTIGCHAQMLRPGETTRSHRHTDTTIYHVVRGDGMTTVGQDDKEVLRWGERDCFIVPPWQWHRHENESTKEPAILFSVTDRPAIEALGYHREEGEGGR